MKYRPFVICALVGLSDAFMTQPASSMIGRAPTISAAQAVPVEPEPEGGKEITAVTSSLPGCRMKQMDELSSITSDLGTPYQFWMTAEVEASLIKEIRTQILKDASKKANFPGFRKVRTWPLAALFELTCRFSMRHISTLATSPIFFAT